MTEKEENQGSGSIGKGLAGDAGGGAGQKGLPVLDGGLWTEGPASAVPLCADSGAGCPPQVSASEC